MTRPRLSLVALAPALAVLTLAASPAFAHPGHGADHGFVAGLLHPLTGLDHLATMLMVGLWAGIAFPRRWWVCPAAFVGFMALGFVHGASGGAMAIAETLILASPIALGLALLLRIEAPIAAATAIVATFAVAHGFAHGSEMAPGTDPRYFATGFIVTTVGLLAIGLGLSRLVGRVRKFSRAAGAVPAGGDS
jgi:urease accessory protein